MNGLISELEGGGITPWDKLQLIQNKNKKKT